MEQENNNNISRILVLGGSSFVGLTLLKELSKKYGDQPNTHIYYINRGKTYWNNQVKSLENLFYINGNRNDKEEFRKLLSYTSKKLGISQENKWTSVIDMCAFKWQNINSVYEGLKGLVKQYVFISTDSVYDVCLTEPRGGKKLSKKTFSGKFQDIDLEDEYSGTKVQEQHAIRFSDPKDRKKAKEDEDYGHAKLMCEEFMYNEIDKNQFPFIILRFADVIGPYDDTGRYWSYVKWMIEHNDVYPIPQDTETTRTLLSFVYSQDIVQLILSIISNADQYLSNFDFNNLQGITLFQSKDQPQNPLFQSFNLACEETLTLEEMQNEIYDNIPQEKRMSKNTLNCESVSNAPAFFPSVDCGPISIQRAKNVFNWKPTHIRQVIQTTTQFFVQINNGEYRSEEKYVETKLFKKMKR